MMIESLNSLYTNFLQNKTPKRARAHNRTRVRTEYESSLKTSLSLVKLMSRARAAKTNHELGSIKLVELTSQAELSP